MPTNLLILPLLGGFLLVHIWHLSRFRSQRLEGYRLLFETAVAGVILVTIARIITYSLAWSGVVSRVSLARWNEFAPIPFSGTGALAFLLGVTVPFIANLVFRRQKAQDWAIHHYGSNLLRLLHTATKYEMLISVTLDNRKVYVGFVITAPNLQSNDQYIQLLPLLSGYRDAADLRMKFTTNYAQVYPDVYQASKLDPSDFVIIIPAASIRMANLYDPSIPMRLFEVKDGASEEPLQAVVAATKHLMDAPNIKPPKAAPDE
jgi:hypothetical protein